ncbi:hypothetical protein [Streptomyces luteogriseus]|uniref:hypothetical protein n=1 Tax=Streptomyces luteogriseus TaxID=68233 RepID=UPI0037B79DF2
MGLYLVSVAAQDWSQSREDGYGDVAAALNIELERRGLPPYEPLQAAPEAPGWFEEKERGQPTDLERRLRKKITKLKELRAADKEQLAQLATDVENLVRVVNQLTLENRQLRRQLATPGPIVRLLPAHPQPQPLRQLVRQLKELGAADAKESPLLKADVGTPVHVLPTQTTP